MPLLLQGCYSVGVPVQTAKLRDAQEASRRSPCADARKEVQHPFLTGQWRERPALQGAITFVEQGDSSFRSRAPPQAVHQDWDV